MYLDLRGIVICMDSVFLKLCFDIKHRLLVNNSTWAKIYLTEVLNTEVKKKSVGMLLFSCGKMLL